MKATAALLAVLAAHVGALNFDATARDVAPKQYPVTKVITLLKDMQQQLQKEADEDQEVFEKMDCWCKTNDKDKTQSIQDAETRISELATLIETSAANSARLQEEIKNHEADLAKSQQSLDTATALREKQLGEFNAEEKELLESVRALDAAITVLSKHHPSAPAASFLDDGAMTSALEVAQMQMKQHAHLLRSVITPKQQRLILGLRQDSASGQPYGKPSFRQNYVPQSSEIFGILRQMKEEFESNLSAEQKEELANSKAYESLKAAKQEEIAATVASLEQKKMQLAEADETNAKSKQDKEDTQNSLSTDEKFLLDVKQKCAATDEEFQNRQKMRQDEISAVAEAISILATDDAHDTFSRTFNPASLIQLRSVSGNANIKQKTDAANVLSSAAAKSHSSRLAALATSVRLDPMTKVKEAIDTLIAELKLEKEEEIKHRDSCVDRTNENERATERYTRDHSDLESQAQTLESTIAEDTQVVETLQSEIAEMNLQIKRRGEDREAENKDFQGVVADQRETQQLLHKALAVLKSVYKQKVVNAQADGGASFSQQEPAPQGFSTYGQNRGSGGVVALVEQIIADSAALEKETVNDEQVSQQQYESFVRETNASIEAKQASIVNKNAAKADAKQRLLDNEDDVKDKKAELETLANTAKALDMDCNFVMRNFDIRQEARDEEVEALQQAKAILSGMDLDA